MLAASGDADSNGGSLVIGDRFASRGARPDARAATAGAPGSSSGDRTAPPPSAPRRSRSGLERLPAGLAAGRARNAGAGRGLARGLSAGARAGRTVPDRVAVGGALGVPGGRLPGPGPVDRRRDL